MIQIIRRQGPSGAPNKPANSPMGRRLHLLTTQAVDPDGMIRGGGIKQFHRSARGTRTDSTLCRGLIEPLRGSAMLHGKT